MPYVEIIYPKFAVFIAINNTATGGRLQGLARGQARNHFFAKRDRPG